MKLSQKDKVLLKWLVLFVGLYVIFQFAYTPIQNNLTLRESELDVLVAQKEYTELTLPTYATVLKLEEDTRDILSRRFNHFFDEFESDRLNAYLDPLFIQNGGQIEYFQAALTLVVIPEVLIDESEILNYKIKLLLDEYEKNTLVPNESIIASSDLLKTRVSYRLDISFADYQQLVQLLSELDTSIILTNSTYVFKDGMASLDFDVYSLQKFSIIP